MKPWKWYVYIVECKDGFYYTGMTWNIEKRMEEHKTGLGGKFTGKHGFYALRYVEEFTNIQQARTREYQVKDFSRKKKKALFNVNNYSSNEVRSNIKESSH